MHRRWVKASPGRDDQQRFDCERPSISSPALALSLKGYENRSGSSLHVLGMLDPLEDTVGIARVIYSIEQGDKQTRIEPFSIAGAGHERFEVRIEGSTPTWVLAELFNADGLLIRTLNWSR